MATIRLTNFDGEMPRVPARNLSPGAAQVSSNLLATSQEFRPMKTHSVVAAKTSNGVSQATLVVPANADTLYRFQTKSGDALEGDEDGWVAWDRDVNIVRGSNPDDTTELTYMTYRNGGSYPRITKNSANHASPTDFYISRLGITRPPKPVVNLLKCTKWHRQQAMDYLEGSVIPAVVTAITENLNYDQFTGRVVDGVAKAGISTSFPTVTDTTFAFTTADPSIRGVYEPWTSFVQTTSTIADEGLGNPLLSGSVVTDGYCVPLVGANPFWGGLITPNTLNAKLTGNAKINVHNQTVLTTDTKAALITYIESMLNPATYPQVAYKRQQLDGLFGQFSAAVAYLVNNPKPAKGTMTDEAYAAVLSAWEDGQRSAVNTCSTSATQMVDVSHEIEAIYGNLISDLAGMVRGFFATVSLERTQDVQDGLFIISPEPVIDTRLYITTYVTELGEESSPSEPSDFMDVDWNDLVVITAPSRLTDPMAMKWRLYRTQAGSAATEFAFVIERDYPTAPATSVNTPVISPHIGDLLSPAVVGQIATKWNGSSYILQEVLDISSYGAYADNDVFIDGAVSDKLGDLCETTTWLPPPYRCTPETAGDRIPTPFGTNPYLRGLTSMPNGVIAGFVDNYVAFCEPYSPYAWPVAYQVPVGFPIVGLCSFGQSLFVGTRAYPYVISGADPSQMTPRKLPQSQACVSDKSMVSAMGGVFYASQDGYCFANETGVEVVSEALFSNEDWQALSPETIIACVHDNVLYFWYTPSGHAQRCYGMDLTAQKLVRHDIGHFDTSLHPVTAVFEDVVTDSVYACSNQKIIKVFGGSTASEGRYLSGIATLPKHAPMGWVRVLSDCSTGNPVDVDWIADGSVRHTSNFTNNEPQRLPPGRYLEHSLEVRSKARVTLVEIAGSTAELQSV